VEAEGTKFTIISLIYENYVSSQSSRLLKSQGSQDLQSEFFWKPENLGISNTYLTGMHGSGARGRCFHFQPTYARHGSSLEFGVLLAVYCHCLTKTTSQNLLWRRLNIERRRRAIRSDDFCECSEHASFHENKQGQFRSPRIGIRETPMALGTGQQFLIRHAPNCCELLLLLICSYANNIGKADYGNPDGDAHFC
jgi:hypothetical protein